ncbi:gp53-like domain-containing protein [Yersinia proxima]|uniref:gp53-like domain-containing protein n=1 Tax=Yersinia proxima TaxID=2890316 RepID=UPI0037D577B3
MSDIVITITDAGRREIINASNTGSDPVLISAIGVGTQRYVPNSKQTALKSELKRIMTFGGSIVAPDTIHISVKDDSTDVYKLYEFGLYTDKGTLFAVYSQASPIIDKTASSIMLLSVDIVLQTPAAANIKFGDIEFINPPATEQIAGVAKLATFAEAKAGLEPQKILTPKVAAGTYISIERCLDEIKKLGTRAVNRALSNIGALPVTGTAVSAKRLAVARRISGVAFDGTSDITLTARDVNALPANGTADAAKKLALSRRISGIAFDGTRDITLTARDVNALPANGTADAAQKLAFSRKIAGVSFDGTRDIRLSARDVNALPANGTADAAQKLAFSRKIAGVSFDGTRDIRLSARDVNALPANGTADAAKKLAIPRRIAGVFFDGTTDINLDFGGVASKAENGWYSDTATGLIIQWCTGPGVIHETLITTSFPIPFPSACLIAFVSTKNPAQHVWNDLWYQVVDWNTTHVRCVLNRSNQGSTHTELYPQIFAIGF